MGVWDYIKVFRKRIWLLIFVTVVISTAVAVVTVNLPDVYQARSRLLVEKVRPGISGAQDFFTGSRDRWFTTQTKILSSRMLVEAAAERVGYEDVPDLADEPDPIEALGKRLKVMGVEGSGLIDVSAEGSDPKFIRDFVNALVDEYRRFASAFRRETSARLLRELNNQIESVKKDAEAKHRAIARFKKDQNLGLIDEQRRIAFSDLDKITAAATSARLSRMKALTDYNAIRELNDLPPVWVDPARVSGGVDIMQKVLDDALAQKGTGEETSEAPAEDTGDAPATQETAGEATSPEEEVAEETPAEEPAKEPAADSKEDERERKARTAMLLTLREEVDHLRNEILSIDRHLDALANKYTAEVMDELPEVKELRRRRARKTEELDEKQQLLAQQDTEMQLYMAEAIFCRTFMHEGQLLQDRNTHAVMVRAMSNKITELEVFEKEEEILTKVLDSLLENFRGLNMSQETTTDIIRIMSVAKTPIEPFKPNRPANIAMGVFVGLILGGLLCIVVEMSERRLIWTPGDVLRNLGMQTIGFVPNAEDEVSGFRDTALSAVSYPKGGLAEAGRKIGVRLWSDRRRKGGMSVMATSCTPAEGKTTVLTNVAAALAQSGHRVVMVDADVRRPRLHGVFEIPMEKGLLDFLEETQSLDEILKQTFVKNIRLITAGRVEGRPFTLSDAGRFTQLLEELRAQADVILVDASPILGVSEVGVMSREVDETLLVIEAGRVPKSVAVRGVEMIIDLGGKVAGVVLSNVRYSKGDYHYYSRHYVSS